MQGGTSNCKKKKNTLNEFKNIHADSGMGFCVQDYCKMNCFYSLMFL